MSIETLRGLREHANRAREAYEKAVPLTFKVGMQVEIERGRSTYWAEVAPLPHEPTRCTSYDRVWVKGDSGKCYWLHAYRIVSTLGRGRRSQPEQFRPQEKKP